MNKTESEPTKDDLKNIIRQLLSACRELMAESGKKRAADWEIINDAMVAGERAVAKN